MATVTAAMTRTAVRVRAREASTRGAWWRPRGRTRPGTTADRPDVGLRPGRQGSARRPPDRRSGRRVRRRSWPARRPAASARTGTPGRSGPAWMLGAASGAVAAMASSRPGGGGEGVAQHLRPRGDRHRPLDARWSAGVLSPKMSRAKNPRANAARTAIGQRVTAKATSAATVASGQADATNRGRRGRASARRRGRRSATGPRRAGRHRRRSRPRAPISRTVTAEPARSQPGGVEAGRGDGALAAVGDGDAGRDRRDRRRRRR